MLEAKPGRNIRIQQEQSGERTKLEQFFKKRFPKTYKSEVAERDRLLEYTSKVIDFPEEIYKPFNFVNGIAKKGGFNEVLITPNTNLESELTAGYSVVVIKPNDKANVSMLTPFNSLVFPENYLKNLNDLLSSAMPDYPKKYAADAVSLMIEFQAEFKNGRTRKAIEESYIKKEAGLVIHDNKETVLAEIIELKIRKQENLISQSSFKEQLTQKNIEFIKLSKEEVKKANELSVQDGLLPMIARNQFVEKIKEDPKRNLVEDIATLETLSHLLDSGIMHGLGTEERIIAENLNGLYPDPILDAATRKEIIIKQREIRKELIKLY